MRFSKFIREDEAGKKPKGPPTNVDKVKQQQDYENAKAKRAQLVQLQKAQADDLKNKQKDDLKKQGEKEQEKRLGIKHESLGEATEVKTVIAGAKARAFRSTGKVLAAALDSLARACAGEADMLRDQIERLTKDWGADNDDAWDEATDAEHLSRKFDQSASQFTQLANQIESGRYDWQTHHALAHALELMVDLKKTIA
jgi:hypothetical protein